MDKQTSQQRDLVTVAQFTKRYSWANEGGLRFQIFQSDKNGLKQAAAIVRIGRKVLIDVPRYFEWIDSQQEQAA